MAETKKQVGDVKTSATAKHVWFDEYKGNDMVVFGEPDSRYPLQFGKEKAKKLVRAIETDSLHEVLKHIYAVAGEGNPNHLVKAPLRSGKRITKKAETA